RAVLDSGSKSAMEPDLEPPPPPPPPPPPLLLLVPQPATATAAMASAGSTHAIVRFTTSFLLSFGCLDSSSPDRRLHAAGERPVGLADDEHERAEQLGAIPERARDHADVARRAGDGVAANGVAHRLEQQAAGRGQAAADDDELGVELVAQPGDHLADGAPGVGDDARARRVALAGEGDHAVDGQAVAPQQLEQRVGAGEGLQAATQAAAAHRAVLVDQ